MNGQVHKDGWIYYDEQSRIKQVGDSYHWTEYSYDASGNRTRILSEYDTYSSTETDDLWYTYDSMNRVTVSQGVNDGGTIGINSTRGIELTYDLKGQRASAREYGLLLNRANWWVDVEPDPNAEIWFPAGYAYGYTSDYSTESYGYDSLGGSRQRIVGDTYVPPPNSTDPQVDTMTAMTTDAPLRQGIARAHELHVRLGVAQIVGGSATVYGDDGKARSRRREVGDGARWWRRLGQRVFVLWRVDSSKAVSAREEPSSTPR